MSQVELEGAVSLKSRAYTNPLGCRTTMKPPLLGEGGEGRGGEGRGGEGGEGKGGKWRGEGKGGGEGRVESGYKLYRYINEYAE